MSFVPSSSSTSSLNGGPMSTTSQSLRQSCQRCKIKKVYCDTKEPCNRCVEKGLGQECIRLPRKQRIRHPRKRSKRHVQPIEVSLHNSSDKSQQISIIKPIYITQAVYLLQSVSLCQKLLRSIYVSTSSHRSKAI